MQPPAVRTNSAGYDSLHRLDLPQGSDISQGYFSQTTNFTFDVSHVNTATALVVFCLLKRFGLFPQYFTSCTPLVFCPTLGFSGAIYIKTFGFYELTENLLQEKMSKID